MAGIINPATRLTKPAHARITINGNMSLSNALVGLWAFTNPTDYRNLVTGVMGTIGGDFPATSFGIIGGQGGIGWSTPHAGQAMVDTGGSVVTDGAPTSIFACAHVSQLPPANWVYSAFSNQAVSNTGIDLQFGNGFGSSSGLYATGNPGDATTAWCDGAKDPTVNPLTNAVLVPNRVTVLAASYAAAYTHSKNIEIGRAVSGVVGYFAGTIYIVGAWNRQITDSEGAWVTHSPYDLIKPDIRKTYYITSTQVTAGGGTVTGDGNAAGTGTATAAGASTAAGAANAAGTGTAQATATAIKTTAGTAAGAGVASGTGAATAAGVGNATGQGLASAVSTPTTTGAAAGAAAGASSVAGVGAAIVARAGTAAGAGAAVGVGAGLTTAASAASAAGTSAALAIGAATAAGKGAATGTSAATAVAIPVGVGLGFAAGTSTAHAIGTSTTANIHVRYSVEARKSAPLAFIAQRSRAMAVIGSAQGGNANR